MFLSSYRFFPFLYSIRENAESFRDVLSGDKNTLNLFLFLLSNLLFVSIIFLYGFCRNSVGVILDSLNMLFDCAGFLPGLSALIAMKWKRDDKYTYGYVKAEVMSNLVNGLFSLYIAFFVTSEAVKRFTDHANGTSDHFLQVCTLRFVLNVIGVYVFRRNLRKTRFSRDVIVEGLKCVPEKTVYSGSISYGDDHKKDTYEDSKVMDGVFLHILAVTLRCVSDVSSTVMQMFYWSTADAILSLTIAASIVYSVAGLIMESVLILMQRQPIALDDALPSCYQKVLQLDGVYSVQEPHFWTLYGESYVGSLKLEVSADADPNYVINHANNIFTAVGVQKLYVQLDYTPSL